MGLSKEENNRRREDDHVKYIAEHICRNNTGKPYVFISYKSDDWELVLCDIVYRLVKDKGLNVYFDGDFNGHNPLWTEQFPENMESENCYGVLAFVDDAYTSSYATLMELLYSQAGCQEEKPPYNYIKKPVVTVNLNELTQIRNEENTGLGVGIYEDGKVNIHANDEKQLFDELFYKAADLKVLKNTVKPYKKANMLSKELCATMTREVLSYIGANDNLYGAGCTLEDICETIKNACGEDVFRKKIGSQPIQECSITFVYGEEEAKTKLIKSGERIVKPEIKQRDGFEFKGWFYKVSDSEIEWNFEKDTVTADIELVAKWEKLVLSPDEPQEGSIALKDFLEKYNNNNFKKSTFSRFRLAGEGEYSKYGTDYYDSAFDLSWAFVMTLLSERGVSYIEEVNGIHAEIKNPVFITAEVYSTRDDQNRYKQIEVTGLENYYMYRHYGQYDWIASVLKQRLIEFGLPLEKFCFEYQINNEKLIGITYNEPPTTDGSKPKTAAGNLKSKPITTGGGITGPVALSGGEGVKQLNGQFTLTEFLGKYSNKTFQSKSCKYIKLLGINGCEKYSIEFDENGNKIQTARQLVFNFAMRQLDDMGMEYINLVNANNTSKNPIFITEEEHFARKARNESVTYTKVSSKSVSGYSMCTHYSEYDWLKNSLKKQITALGLLVDNFIIVFEQ